MGHVFCQLACADPARILIAIIQLLWMSVLRFQHMQRSVPVRLTTEFLYGICWKGKGKPAYRWACPRYGPTGADVGGCIWDHRQELARSRAVAPFGFLYEKGVPFSLADLHSASRSILKKHLGMQDTDIFTFYSLRRSMPTLAEMNGTHPDDADAWGDWTSAKDNKMRIRYADSREERSAVVKLTHVLLVRQVAQSQVALSWDACRTLLYSTDKAAVSSQASQRVSGDVGQEATRECLLGLVKANKRKFNTPALTRHAQAQSAAQPGAKRQKAQYETAPDSGQIAAPLPLAEAGSTRRWVMIKHRGTPRVHLLPGGSDVPLCRRRGGQIGTPIVRMASLGAGLREIRQMAWNGSDVICADCFAALPDGGRTALQAHHE